MLEFQKYHIAYVRMILHIIYVGNDGDVIPNLPPIMYNLSVEATPEGNTEYDLRFASNIVGPVTLTNCSVQCKCNTYKC